MKFSQRQGFSSVRSIIQIDNIDRSLRVALWNEIFSAWFSRDLFLVSNHWHYVSTAKENIYKNFWSKHLEEPLDELPKTPKDYLVNLKTYFLECDWFEVYDFIEWFLQNYSFGNTNEMTKRLNSLLESNLSGYRVVGTLITPITSSEEIESIDQSLSIDSKYAVVRTHLQTALERLSDKESPDFRNSIKESISSVEALCKILTDDPKASLGKALKLLNDKKPIPPALKTAFEKLYGYTSNNEGIRHALSDESNLGLADAKYMLVTCSAFVNFLIEKYGIEDN